MPAQTYHVRSTKYDGSPHWEFDSWLVRQEGSLLVTSNYAGQELQTWKGPWIAPHNTQNYFWSDRWYNAMRLTDPDGEPAGWYCNVTTPAEFGQASICYADLDLDVRVMASGDAEILDEDDFLDNSTRMSYPPDVIEQARAAVAELLAFARRGEFPFDAP